MSKNRASAELKRLAKGQLLGRYGGFIAAELIYGTIVAAILLFTTATVDTFSVTGAVIYYAVQFLVQIICCIFGVGMTYMYLQAIQNKSCYATDIFYGFRTHADKIIIIGFFLTAISYILMLPYVLFFWYYQQTSQAIFFLLGCICFVIGESISIYVNITFALSYFIVLDFPNSSAIETLKLSRKFMKGHKGRYLYISISFIPFWLLGFMSFGLGLLWVVPYMGMTFANFYMDLMQHMPDEQPSSEVVDQT